MMSVTTFAHTVIDKITGLMWQDDKASATEQKEWHDVKEYCQNLRLDGYDDWKLPTVEQLLSITDKTKQNPAIISGFQNVVSGLYWSSSPYVSDSNLAWYVGFNFGYSSSNGKYSYYYVRCVRAGQSDTSNFEKAGGFEKLVSFLSAQELASIPKPSSEVKLIKGEFETSRDFDARVVQTKENQKIAIVQYQAKYASQRESAQENAIKKALEITWGKPIIKNLRYDTDNGYFVADISFEAKKDFQKKVAIKVNLEDAKSFKEGFNMLKPQAVFDY